MMMMMSFVLDLHDDDDDVLCSKINTMMLMMMSFVLDLHDDDDDVLCTRPTRLYGFVSTDRE
jgi:hypothetical protein